MKAEELIIGDLVLYFGKVFSILKVDPETELSIIENARHFEQANINDLSPISITPEILEKNGWEHKDDVYFKEYSLQKLVVMDKNAYIINESYSLFLCKVEYVHEFQHLLFGLGINHKMEVLI